MKGHKTCKCGVATHNKSAKIVDNKCPACGEAYPIVEKNKVKREPRQEEIDRTTGGQGWKRCMACEKFTAGARSENCVHCERAFKQVMENTEIEVEVEDDEIVETQRSYEPAPEIQFEIEGYDISEKLRSSYDFPYGAGVLNFAETQPAFQMEGEITKETDVVRWAHELRTHMLGFHRQWLTNGCLFSFLVQQFKGQYDLKSPEMENAKKVLAKLPDVNRAKVFA